MQYMRQFIFLLIFFFFTTFFTPLPFSLGQQKNTVLDKPKKLLQSTTPQQ